MGHNFFHKVFPKHGVKWYSLYIKALHVQSSAFLHETFAYHAYHGGGLNIFWKIVFQMMLLTKTLSHNSPIYQGCVHCVH